MSENAATTEKTAHLKDVLKVGRLPLSISKLKGLPYGFFIVAALLISYGFVLAFPSLSNCLLCDSIENSKYQLSLQFEEFQAGTLKDTASLEMLHQEQNRLLTPNNYGCGMDGECSDEYIAAKANLISLSRCLQTAGRPVGATYLFEEGHPDFDLVKFESETRDPENRYHNYLLGRAYAEGVYTKKDYPKAMNYFSQSFNSNKDQLKATAMVIAGVFQELGNNELAGPWESFFKSSYIGDVDSAAQVMRLQANANKIRGHWERAEYDEIGSFLREVAHAELSGAVIAQHVVGDKTEN